MALALNLQSQIVQRLRQRILSGAIPSGAPLREQSLAKEFGISRGPIRDAFLLLSKEGLLVAKPNVGMRVASEPSLFKRELIVRLRREIESTALAHWFEHRNDQLLEDLAVNLKAYKAACRKGDLDPVVELDMEFHRQIVTAADGASLFDLWHPVTLQMFLRYSRHHTLLESHAEHLGIYDAMKAGQADLAVRRLQAHIQ